ncbi:cytochrome ubiquinol oxidase subunit I [Leptothermofonsia sp. ETS-13]|uniref:cytochrome ubiquinol oxidase subunit I n=1 Tax=Leptothermofonsia sp. ETS-13 TaxID=3035696 RepID=UPI003B9DE7D9
MQFALTVIFHTLWPVLTTGMGIYLVVVKGLWLKTRNPDYYSYAFLSKALCLEFWDWGRLWLADGVSVRHKLGTFLGSRR